MRGLMPGAEVAGGLALESVADRHVPGMGKTDLHRLRRGLVNETYRVLRDGNAYALRAAATNPYDLGLDRHWEARVLEGAVAAELAPPLVYCDPERGILISRWVEGRSWSPEDTLRPRVMTPGQWMDRYSAAAPTAQAAALRSMAVERLSALATLPDVVPVVCHSDLHTLNLIDRGGSLVLLDWEYAHAADPFWDLAGWSANNDFEDEPTLALLANYLGRTPTPEECLRLRHLSWLYDYVCLLWSELYLSLHRGRPSRVAGGPAFRGDAASGESTPGDSALGEVSGRAQLLASRLRLPE
jgi:aminoglycoside phosphotransferase (APT) family kinase protein